jgi:hypothetical protein
MSDNAHRQSDGTTSANTGAAVPYESGIVVALRAGPLLCAGETGASTRRLQRDNAPVGTTRDPSLTVTFHRVDGSSPSAWWEAVRPTRGRFRGGYMPIGRGRIPHDLGHMATEAHLGIRDGFWGLLARGATFDHGTQQRPTRPGRQLIRDNRAALNAAEKLGNSHHFAWANGQPTPVAATFDRLAKLWERVLDGGTLTLRWPTLELSENTEG